MSVAIKGNRPLRIFAVLMLILLAVSHFMGQIDLTQISFLWLMILMALNAIQASYTGFCPMFKNSRGECVACGVVCDADAGDKSCCSDDSCCDSSAADKNKKSACCSDEDSCCSPAGEKSSCCGDSQKSACCDDALEIKVLGTGCSNCNNTVALIEKVAGELDVCVKVSKIEDVAEIASYGVMSTPGVVVNDKVVHSGGVPTHDQVAGWLQSES
ncbi:MTH895/ArsE family thioredoxin-like protein [Thiomicrorhabdus sp. 6S3-12]|uniref:MTH895/ArsE family thioredoxin-like protein n=1 Tax=Thiomicrorhabdus sp. 6S3-12 TaxID=2819681 RepID=UPI001FB8295B|nr:MTH895/ArsE family thioredoxin-like protein [Thiomicrorhabdus sp. 6S3-12]